MSKKVIAAWVVTVWLGFFGVEVLGVFGLVSPARADVAASVEATLTNLTRAEISDERLPAEPGSIPVFFNVPSTESFPFGYSPRTAKFVKDTPRIYKLNVAFLL